MAISIHQLKGKVRGHLIELDRDPGLPDGEDVTVTIERRSVADMRQTPGDGLRSALGSWAEDGEGLDRFIEETYRARHTPHRNEME